MATTYIRYGLPRRGSGPSTSSSPSRYGAPSRDGNRGGGSYSDRSARPGNGRPSYNGGRPSYGGNRGGSNGGSRFGGRGGNRPGGENIPVERFIHKAEPIADVVAYVPKYQFSDFPIDERIKRNLADKGYTTPTPIQDQSIMDILEGKDIVGLANTGTGKTGAFLIPLIHRTITDANRQVLIMVPTRELAVQIAEEFRGFARTLSLRAALCVGGAGIFPQVSALRQHPAFVIGTPGRLKDLMERGALKLAHFDTVVLDEADRMLDMGFIADMRFILSKMEPTRHTLFFSATMSRDIEKLIGEFLKNPVQVSVRTGNTAKTVDQDIVRAGHGPQKFETLMGLLSDSTEFSKVLIFGRTKHGVERLAKDLTHRGIRAEAIHGNKTHGKRLQALDLFKKDKVQVLVATDVAARGLDISGVSHVINFDVPNTYEDYVHRIGRTGRAGKAGKALTFV